MSSKLNKKCLGSGTNIQLGNIKFWVEITTVLRLGDLRCHDQKNNHLVAVMELWWSWFKEAKSECWSESGNEQQSSESSMIC